MSGAFCIFNCLTNNPQRRGVFLRAAPAKLLLGGENSQPPLCRGGYQPPATLRFLSGWLNGEMLVICTNSPDLTQFCKVVPRGRLVASPTEAGAKSTPSNNNLIYCKTKGIRSFSLYHQIKINATKKIFQIPPVQNRNCVVK